VPEKNDQVAQMRDVYLSSKRVLVWLGEEGTAKTAIDFCRKLKENEKFGLSNDQFQMRLEACYDLFVRRSW
jgi:hypothetical protein